jgi:signal peptidase II
VARRWGSARFAVFGEVIDAENRSNQQIYAAPRARSGLVAPLFGERFGSPSSRVVTDPNQKEAARLPGVILAACVAVGLDQVSKLLVVHRLAIEQAGQTSVRLPVRLRRVRGRSVGVCQIRNVGVLAICWILVAIATLVLTASASPVWIVGVGLALGGAAGNLLDLIFRGAVVDFVDVGVWPVFNLADAAIVVGAAIALVSQAG